MNYKLHTYCSYCGHKFAEALSFPRQCVHCQSVTYLNPIPVAVLLLPVQAGLLVLRRGIEPRRGKIALPGGYMEMNETWQEACIRECAEETGITLSADKVTHFQTLSNGKDRILIFGLYQQTLPAVPVFTLTEETAAIFVLNKEDFKPEEIAFPLHTAVLQDWFGLNNR